MDFCWQWNFSLLNLEFNLDQLFENLKEGFYLPFGECYDPDMLQCDTCSSDPLNIAPNDFHFYGATYNQLWVQSNGWIFFTQPTSSGYTTFYDANGFPSLTSHVADYDSGDEGTIYFRSMLPDSTNVYQFARVENLLKSFTSITDSSSVNWMFVMTYDGVVQFNGNPDEVNSWQVILAASGTKSYAIMKWEDMQWGHNSGIDRLGYHKANVGGVNFFKLGVTEFTLQTWNTGCAGLLVHRIDTDPPIELEPDLPVPDASLTFLGNPQLAVASDETDPTKLIVSLSPTPPSPPDGIVIVKEYENCCNYRQSWTADVYPSEVTGLQQATGYTFYLSAINRCGVAIDGTPLSASATTSGEVQTEPLPDTNPPPSNVAITAVTCNTATFTWDIAESEDGCVAATFNYVVQHASTGDVINDFVISADGVEVGGLSPDSAYTFQIRTNSGPLSYPPLGFVTAELDPPIQVQNLTAMSGGSTTDSASIIVSWLEHVEAMEDQCALPITGYIIQYQLTNRGQCQHITNPIKVSHGTTNAFQSTITGLELYSTYEIFVTAQTQEQGTAPSSVISVTTSDAVPFAVDNLQVNGDESTSTVLHVSWTYPGSEQCLKFNVDYELINRDQCEVVSSSTVVRYAVVSSSSVDIKGLEDSYSTYRVYVTPESSSGITGPVQTQTGITMEARPEMIPRNLIMTQSTARSITFTVGPVPCTDSHGEILGLRYILNERTPSDGITDLEVTRDTVDVSPTGISTVTIPNLKPCTTYDLWISAGTNVGYGEHVSVIIDTDITEPAAVENLKATIAASNRFAIITWEFYATPSNPCVPNEFLIEYKQTHCNIVITERIETKRTSAMTAIITFDHLPNAIYEIWVTSMNSAGKGQEQSITTMVAWEKTAPIASPPNVFYTETDGNQVTFVWDEIPCEIRRSDSVYYVYELRRESSSTTDQTGNQGATSVILTLEPRTTYSFRVAVVNDYGTGPYNEVIYTAQDSFGGAETATLIAVGFSSFIMFAFGISLLLCMRIIYNRRQGFTNSPPRQIPFQLEGDQQQLYMTRFQGSSSQPWSGTMNSLNSTYY